MCALFLIHTSSNELHLQESAKNGELGTQFDLKFLYSFWVSVRTEQVGDESNVSFRSKVESADVAHKDAFELEADTEVWEH